MSVRRRENALEPSADRWVELVSGRLFLLPRTDSQKAATLSRNFTKCGLETAYKSRRVAETVSAAGRCSDHALEHRTGFERSRGSWRCWLQQVEHRGNAAEVGCNTLENTKDHLHNLKTESTT